MFHDIYGCQSTLNMPYYCIIVVCARYYNSTWSWRLP